jgi:hypothetical protein
LKVLNLSVRLLRVILRLTGKVLVVRDRGFQLLELFNEGGEVIDILPGLFG